MTHNSKNTRSKLNPDQIWDAVWLGYDEEGNYGKAKTNQSNQKGSKGNERVQRRYFAFWEKGTWQRAGRKIKEAGRRYRSFRTAKSRHEEKEVA